MAKHVNRASDPQIKLRAAACSRMSVSIPQGKLTAEGCRKTGLKISSKHYEGVSHIHREAS
jgi:hypothetical protein